MRIRVAHVNQLDAKPADIFKLASSRHIAWFTAATEDQTYLEDVADRAGYKVVSLPDSPHWVAVRADLIKDENFVASANGEFVPFLFSSTPEGLGEIVVAAGVVDGEALSEALDVSLVFYAGFQDGELGFGFYDRDSRVQKLKTDPKSNDNYLEAIITL